MAKTEKLDLYRQHRDQYVARRKPVLVEVPPVPYLALDGQGEPSGEAFTAGLGAMYAAAFTIKMASKFAGRDYKVCHLEGQWWAAGKGKSFLDLPRDQWRWKLLIRVPDFITQAELKQARQTLLEKGKDPLVTHVKLQTIQEGLCVQMLHVGPYAGEPETIEAMAEFAEDSGLTFHGRHHEIYLSDARRVPPERLRTILRHPVRRS